ncbi:MAG: sigma-70 family RNA polymerase sigma factor [Mariniphaga sp.]|nr:sigma-70 family RNA polymerase sigma factor [Mariniphaga sp.]
MNTNTNFTENARQDAGLVMAARSGDEKAFSKLMSRYKDAIYFRLLKMVDYKIDAEELTIETFEKAFTRLHQYEADFAFSTWLYSIAFNHALDHLRKKRIITVPLESKFENGEWIRAEYDDNLKTYSDNPEEELIKKQNAILLRKTISCLKPKYQKIIEMRYFKEYSYSEIAEELNLPLVTVKVHLYRSREMLLELLKSNDISCWNLI